MQNRMMDWDDVKIFLAIAKAGSLGAAARACGQTQPTMGRRLKALEASLGQTLFQRTSHGFVLTDEGAAILAHAQRMEEEAVGLSGPSPARTSGSRAACASRPRTGSAFMS
jgi:DNA-binding transcriptional LysR family regulator